MQEKSAITIQLLGMLIWIPFISLLYRFLRKLSAIIHYLIVGAFFSFGYYASIAQAFTSPAPIIYGAVLYSIAAHSDGVAERSGYLVGTAIVLIMVAIAMISI